ncbi:MAG TPA: AtpZ/AtpI family protein [Candidatus Acidoferrum sp.]
MDDNPNKTDSAPTSAKKGKGLGTQFGLAMELPFVFVAAVVIGGGLGYFIDHWLHTKFIFMFVLGGLGFFAGLHEILRRLPG